MSSILAVPAIASAQVVIEPPGAYVAPPAPVYAAPPPPPVYAPPVYAPPPPRYYAPPPIYVQPAPHIIIRTKVRWWRRAGVYVQPAPVVIAPPAVYVQPAPQPVYVEQAPPPVYYAPPAPPAAPAPVLALARPYAPPPPWSARFGLGVRGTGQVVNDQWNNMGIGGELLYRVSAHVSTELACEYQKNVNGPVDRIDIPTTLGVRLHIGRPSWVVSPYFVAAAGLDVAWQDLRFATDTAYYFDGQVGGGLELRLGQHVAITADARFDGKKRVNDPEPAVALTTSLNGKPVAPLGDQYGGQFRLGFAVYF
ncbi:MAG TPA: hypothetical protein VFF06_02865 [Polyangia bacterium]|nr:hypothetical protein [Polyangia bacterium]